MTEAYRCDYCDAIYDGKPYAIVRLVSKDDEQNHELCGDCYTIISESFN